MGGSGDWGMPCSNASAAGSAGHPSMMRPGMEYNSGKSMMPGPMVGRSNSVPGSRSMLQQQLMDMGEPANGGQMLTLLFLSKGGYSKPKQRQQFQRSYISFGILRHSVL